MPRKKSPEPFKKITINVFESDYIRMAELYPSVGAQIAIRHLIRQHVTDLLRSRRIEVDQIVEELDIEEQIDE